MIKNCNHALCDECPFPCIRHDEIEAERRKAKMSKTYKVKKGDTLSEIAQNELGNANRYKEIMSLNGLKTTLIKVGQILKLPTKSTVSDTSESDSKVLKQLEKALNDISKLDSVKTLLDMLEE